MLFVVAMLVAVASAEVSQCQGCHQDSLNEDLTKARIEWVKMQILLKLRLDQPPHVNGVRELPAPLRFENSMLLDTHTTPTPESTEDFYGKTEKVIFFPQEFQNITFFDLKLEDIENEDVANFNLWYYRSTNDPTRTLRLYSIPRESLLLEIVLSTSQTAGWINLDLTGSIRIWLGSIRNESEFKFSLWLKQPASTSSIQHELIPAPHSGEHQPFLLINTDSSTTKKKRNRREVNCYDGLNDCCRDKLYISFKDIEWDDWILEPKGYEAYFCRGSCASAATSITDSGTHHSSVLRRLFEGAKTDNLRTRIVPCCTATKLSSISLLYLDSKRVAHHAILPNLVVETCGCM